MMLKVLLTITLGSGGGNGGNFAPSLFRLLFGFLFSKKRLI
jgi:H+/Cl- antiporter ClcA